MLQTSGYILILFLPVLIHSSCDPRWTFQCDDGTCIPNSRRCNDRKDCFDGEDEMSCGLVPSCGKRNQLQLRYNKYRCSRKCRTTKDCALDKICICDDECGMSCISAHASCKNPPTLVRKSVGYNVIRFQNNTRNVVKSMTDFKVGDMILYKCADELIITGPLPRCMSDGTWTKVKPKCVDFSKCGQAGQVRLKKIPQENEIVHGDDSTETAWPWFAMVTRKKWNAYMTFNKCSILGGGSLINNKWVLTAAHLFASFHNRFENPDKWFKEVVVTLGVIEKPDGNNILSVMKIFALDMILIHEGFKESTFEGDIALVKLGNRISVNTMEEIPKTNHGVQFSYFIRPVCLPCIGSCINKRIRKKITGKTKFTENMNKATMCKLEGRMLAKDHGKVVVTGFGHTLPVHTPHEGCITIPPRLQQGQLRVLSTSKCKKAVANINRNNTLGISMVFDDNFICCIGKDLNTSVDACQGDSGGPVVRKILQKGSRESCWTQIGIVSWGVGCGSGLPAFYTNVANFIGWINDTINGYEKCQRPTEIYNKAHNGPISIKNSNDNDVSRVATSYISGSRCAVLRRESFPGGAPGVSRNRKGKRSRKRNHLNL